MQMQTAISQKMDSIKQAEYILKVLIENRDQDYDDSFVYKDLNNQTQEAYDKEELKSQFLDIIIENLGSNNLTVISEMIDNELNKIPDFGV